MKHLFLFSAFLVLLIPHSQAGKTTVTFKVVHHDPEAVYVLQNLQDYKIDTLVFKNDMAVYKADIKETTPFAIAQWGVRLYSFIILDPGTKPVYHVDLKTVQITSFNNSPSQVKFDAYQNEQRGIQENISQINQSMGNPEINRDSLQQVANNLTLSLNQVFLKFVDQNRSNNLGAYVLFDGITKSRGIPKEEIEKLYAHLDDKGKQTVFGKGIENHKNKLGRMEIGGHVPDFSLPDRNGKIFSLRNIDADYILLDFWASWCGPCVKEIPHLKEAYEKYAKKGFSVMSISIDSDEGKWMAALDKYEMPWLQVLDHKDGSGVTQKLFYVPTIPKTLLLDRQGNVLATDLRGPALSLKLAELMKE